MEMEPDRDLKNDVCLVKLEDEPTVLVKNSARPLNTVAPMPREPARDSPTPFIWEPAKESESVRVLARPFVCEVVNENEPVSALESELRSVRLETEDSEPVSVLYSEICSLGLDAVVNEPVTVLKNEECSAGTEERLNEPDRLLVRPLVSEPATDNESVNVLDSET
jgi:hypothetical protein